MQGREQEHRDGKRRLFASRWGCSVALLTVASPLRSVARNRRTPTGFSARRAPVLYGELAPSSAVCGISQLPGT